jgi:uncharacterized protein (TIRG00374 family)
MRNPKIQRLVQILVTLGLILFVCYSAGFFSESGRSRFANIFSTVSWLIVGASVLVSFIQNLVSVRKWQLVVLAKELNGSFFRLFKYLYIGRLYNMILPSSMGGDVVRVYRLGKYNNNMELAAASVFVERFVGMLILLLLSAISLSFLLGVNDELFIAGFVFVLIVTLALGWAAVDPRFVELLKYLAAKVHITLIQKVADKFENFQVSIRKAGRNRVFLGRLFAYSIVFYILAILSVWVSALAFDRHVNLVDMIIAVPAIMLIMNLPVSIGGLGLMEASYTVAFELLGYSAELGLATALIMRGKAIIDALLGGLLELKK